MELVNLNRYETKLMSGTEIRKALSSGSKELENHVLRLIKILIEELYLVELTVNFYRKK